MSYTTESGAPVTLNARLGSGGEADVYAVGGQANLVAKVYKNPSDLRTAKLKVMVANPPVDPTAANGHISICWPQTLLFDGGECTGFLMHRVDFKTSVPLLELYNPAGRQQVSTGFTWQYLMRTAVNIASAFESIHSHCYVVGDVNESNVLATNQALVTLVDCDSMQVYDSSMRRFYRCPVGKAEFTPPELQKMSFSTVDRSQEHDNFGLGILIFMLLMEGIHPFANGVWVGAGDPPPIEDRIRNCYSPYAGSAHVKPMPAAPPFEILPPEVRQLVERCFRDGHADPAARPTPKEWLACLRQVEPTLQTCAQSHLHVYGAHLANCPWCERKNQLGLDPFPEVAAAPVKKAPAPQAPLKPSSFQTQTKPRRAPSVRTRSPYFKKLAVGAISAAAALAVGTFTWRNMDAGNADPYEPRIVQPPAAGQSKATKPAPGKRGAAIHLGSIVLCRGVDQNQMPVGAGVSFAESDFKKHNLTIYAKYQNASAERSTFQVQWHVNGQRFPAGPYALSSGDDAVVLEFPGSVPVGQHSVDILINGALAQHATFTVGEDASPARAVAVPVEASAAAPVAVSAAPASAPTSAKTHSYQVKHKHKLGACSGTLTITPDSMTFSSSEHPVTLMRSEVTVDQDNIRDRSGRTWHFASPGIDLVNILSLWKEQGTVY